MNELHYKGYVFSGDDIQNGRSHRANSLTSTVLEADTLSGNIVDPDAVLPDFDRNDPVAWFEGGQQRGTFYLQEVEPIGPELYSIYATSVIGLLIEGRHYGGIYTGQTAEEIILDICGNIPVMVKTNLSGIQLYGWLPLATPRDNLSQVLFSIGATAKVDLNGVLRIEPLWDGVSRTIDEDHVLEGAKRPQEAKVTEFRLSEHQYAKGSERKTLFEGTASSDEPITFTEPMHDLQATGFTILESGANWARLSNGVGVLTGAGYIHTVRQITRQVSEAHTPNIKSVSNATLVSLVNSGAIADRMAEYYRHNVSIHTPIMQDYGRPGDVVSIYDPFKRQMVDACISSMDATMSAVLQSQIKATVGFRPPQPDDAEYITERIVLTGSGSITIPEDAGGTLHYVLFSGAYGGHAGLQGGRSGGSRSHTYQIYSAITGEQRGTGTVQVWSGAGGVGGGGGAGGLASRILEGDLEISPGQVLQYNCGIGGLGAVYGAAEGSAGTETTLGDLTTFDGTEAPETGWVDPVTGDVYATVGITGLPGGNGAGAVPGYEIPSGTSDFSQILRYQPSTGATDEDGVYWPGAGTRSMSGNVAYYDKSTMPTGYALGQGGAAGVTLSTPGQTGSYNANTKRATAISGLTGATPTAIPKKPEPTRGGRGGYGGGGGSCASWAYVENYNDDNGYTAVAGSPGPGGNGGQGGPGGDGMIILYISKVRVTQAGRFVTRHGQDFLDRLDRREIV